MDRTPPPEGPFPGDSLPGSPAPGNPPAPDRGTPGRVALGQAVQGQAAPDRAAPGQADLDRAAQGQAAPDAAPDPIALFEAWMAEAATGEPNDPNAVCLATATPDGRPSARMVLLKGLDARGFVFYTNLESRKGEELAGNPHAALCFHWKSLRRQVRVEGLVEPVAPDEADAYYGSRPRGSRIGAWASRQSRPLTSRAELEAAVAEMEARYPEESIPRPAHWSGFRLLPQRLEFWRDMPFRLHDRRIFHRLAAGWRTETLFP